MRRGGRGPGGQDPEQHDPVPDRASALAEALCIARAHGVDGKILFETLTKGSADSFALRNHGMKAMLPGVFPERAFSTDYALKDLSYAIQMAEEHGVPALGADVARELMERAARARLRARNTGRS